jgi:hypothetical protein
MKTRIEAIAELRQELTEMVTPYLSQDSIECVDDAYQEALEIGWYKDELRDSIKFLEEMSDEEYLTRNPILSEDEEETYSKPQYGDIICGDICEDEY